MDVRGKAGGRRTLAMLAVGITLMAGAPPAFAESAEASTTTDASSKRSVGRVLADDLEFDWKNRSFAFLKNGKQTVNVHPWTTLPDGRTFYAGRNGRATFGAVRLFAHQAFLFDDGSMAQDQFLPAGLDLYRYYPADDGISFRGNVAPGDATEVSDTGYTYRGYRYEYAGTDGRVRRILAETTIGDVNVEGWGYVRMRLTMVGHGGVKVTFDAPRDGLLSDSRIDKKLEVAVDDEKLSITTGGLYASRVAQLLNERFGYSSGQNGDAGVRFRIAFGNESPQRWDFDYQKACPAPGRHPREVVPARDVPSSCVPALGDDHEPAETMPEINPTDPLETQLPLIYDRVVFGINHMTDHELVETLGPEVSQYRDILAAWNGNAIDADSLVRDVDVRNDVAAATLATLTAPAIERVVEGVNTAIVNRIQERLAEHVNGGAIDGSLAEIRAGAAQLEPTALYETLTHLERVVLTRLNRYLDGATPGRHRDFANQLDGQLMHAQEDGALNHWRELADAIDHQHRLRDLQIHLIESWLGRADSTAEDVMELESALRYLPAPTAANPGPTWQEFAAAALGTEWWSGYLEDGR